ncbi:Pal1 cell morphology protein-domain-containing protein [Phaeosphaeria sp. MPI-PUGE-AT-0046c]|nr:Pal1 cell morphology protein-domain-containing protein [Phaeosphaeria sp. MPI-PUGE-AT-0046c]
MFAEPSMPERHPSPGLALNLSSNNPFRRAVSPLNSPALNSPASQHRSSSDSRPMSRNPFLSTFEAEFNKEARKTDLIDMSADLKDSPKKATFGPTEELFKNLTIEDNDSKRRPAPPRPAPNRSATDSRPRPQHRPSRSDEEERDRARGAPRGPPRPRGPPGSRPPRPSSRERREHRRPRRNSESSIIDKGSLDPNEERKRRERRKERDERAKDGKSTQRKVRRPQGLDLIDKLDVTGIYGPSMIHHDGPYDAVQPHRNRKKDTRAPMEAFPVGSANNSLGGSGPLNSKIDLDRIHGRGAEGFTDFGGTETEWKKPRVEAEFSAKGRADIIHGQQSHGLGTSTFLEGATASRKAVEEDIQAQKVMAESGLGRKKSIAQRFRGISQPRRQYGDGGRIMSPEARYGAATSPNGPYSAGAVSQTKATELNPFFDEYNKAYDSKGASIKATESSSKDGQSSPGRNALQRAVTSDSIGSPTNEQPKPSGGFLNRVKSMKGGRRRPA